MHGLLCMYCSMYTVYVQYICMYCNHFVFLPREAGQGIQWYCTHRMLSRPASLSRYFFFWSTTSCDWTVGRGGRGKGGSERETLFSSRPDQTFSPQPMALLPETWGVGKSQCAGVETGCLFVSVLISANRPSCMYTVCTSSYLLCTYCVEHPSARYQYSRCVICKDYIQYSTVQHSTVSSSCVT